MHPKAHDDLSIALSPALQELKNSMSTRVGKRKAPEPEELPLYNRMNIEEHVVQVNLLNDVDKQYKAGTALYTHIVWLFILQRLYL